MEQKIHSIRGMNDILPDDIWKWQIVEGIIRKTVEQFCYNEIRTPMLEYNTLFKRGVGENTDVVEKEMYTFEDKSNDMVSLRPEGTAGTVRAVNQYSLVYNQVQRLWYIGEMFRYERPQKGRYRQFRQFGVEFLGVQGFEADVEVLLLAKSLLDAFDLHNSELELHINSIGNLQERKRFQSALIRYLEQFFDKLDADSQKRLYTNPLRIFDSKVEGTRRILENAPKISHFLGEASQLHMSNLCTCLEKLDIKYVMNEQLVRGLDYYNNTVFEWITNELGAQGTILGGGRYDTLVEQLGGQPTPAFGFSMGMERLILLLEQRHFFVERQSHIDVFLSISESHLLAESFELVEKIRYILPNVKVFHHFEASSLKKLLKKSNKINANWFLCLEQDEQGKLIVFFKNLHSGEQFSYDVHDFLNNIVLLMGF